MLNIVLNSLVVGIVLQNEEVKLLGKDKIIICTCLDCLPRKQENCWKTFNRLGKVEMKNTNKQKTSILPAREIWEGEGISFT